MWQRTPEYSVKGNFISREIWMSGQPVLCGPNDATLMPRRNDGRSIPSYFDEGKSIILQGDEGNRTHRRFVPSGHNAVASQS
jgi:hypothetical protein